MKKAIVVKCSEVMTALGERCIPFGGFMNSRDGAERVAKSYNETGDDLARWAWSTPEETEKAQKYFPDHACLVIRDEKEDPDVQR